MVVKRKKLPLTFIAVLVLSLPISAQRSYKHLRPSRDYWDDSQRHVPVRMTRLSATRRLATVGDTLYALDARDHVVWTWSSHGPPLTDLPIVDAGGTIYAIGFDLVWVALDSMTGKEKWTGTACGRATYTQIGLYKRDMYFVVTDMEGYRDNKNSLDNIAMKDVVSICRGDLILWEADIPVGSRIKIEGNKLVAVQKRKNRILKRVIAVPHKFAAPVGKISTFGLG